MEFPKQILPILRHRTVIPNTRFPNETKRVPVKSNEKKPDFSHFILFTALVGTMYLLSDTLE